MGRFTFVLACCLSAIAAAGPRCLAAQADTQDVLQRAHAWTRFGVGSWRQARIVTENFDARGKVTSSSVANNRTTLEEITPDGVTLKVEVTVEVGGQSFPSPPQIVTQGFAGESAGQTVSIKPLDGQTLTVDGRQIDCQAEQIEILGAGSKEVIQINFSPGTTPTILKRTSTMSDATGGTVQEAVSEVFALDKRLRVLDEPTERRGYRLRQVLKSDRGTTTSWSDNVPDIPGEVVTHSAQKFDDQGRLSRRTTLELVDYGVAKSSGDSRELSRRQQRRQQRRGR